MLLSKIGIVLLLHNEHIPQANVSHLPVSRQKERPADVGAVDRCTSLSLVTNKLYQTSIEKRKRRKRDYAAGRSRD